MNKLLVISVLQLALLASILFVLLNEDREPQPPESGQAIAALPVETPQAQPTPGATIDASLIRNIVRSELDAYAARNPVPAVDEDIDANRIDPIEAEARLAWAKESLVYYRTTGEITEDEIEEFQSQVATLDTANRTAMLSELFVEINKGNVRIRP